jgi:hypothetical protein
MPGRPGPKSVEEVGRFFSSVALQQGPILSEFPKKPSSKIELQLLPWDYYSSPLLGYLLLLSIACVYLGCSSDAVPLEAAHRAYLLWMQCWILEHVGKKWQTFALACGKGHRCSLRRAWISLFSGQAVSKETHCRNKSPIACFTTAPPTSEMDRVNGISLGQASTQF